ncbi:MAG: GIY-YIG nuclease family protein [Anaerolineaceae bacterium]|nr:GIY-YIG nuclease family protein [Anaerolineaceae bacterium]
MSDKNGVIYILTNPSFPDYVKIGYADDIEKRLQQLNRSECIPFAFRVYATYEVNSRLSDLKIHTIIDNALELIKFRGVFAERLNGAVAVGGTK